MATNSLPFKWISSNLTGALPKKHVAVVNDLYLERILDGSKTIESRLSKHALPPFKSVKPGDIILFKRSGGSVVARAIARAVLFRKVDEKAQLLTLLATFKTELRLDSDFIRRKADSKYCTLIKLSDVRRVVPYPLVKRDRRGWLVLPTRDVLSGALAPTPTINDPLKSSSGRRVSSRVAAARDLRLRPVPISLAPVSSVFKGLRQNAWRDEWFTKDIDLPALKGATKLDAERLRRTIVKRIDLSLNRLYDIQGELQQYRDGYQTPYTGNILFYGQHALALCCRQCVENWYGIPKNTHLTVKQIDMIAELLSAYVSYRLDGVTI